MSDDAPHASISADPELLDIPWICHAFREGLGHGVCDGQVRAALGRSVVLGAYREGRQIGVLRAVSDGAIFSSITEVFTAEEHRGKGVGSAMMDAAVSHPAIGGTYCILRARPLAVLFYLKWGFRVLEGGVMCRESSLTPAGDSRLS